LSTGSLILATAAALLLVPAGAQAASEPLADPGVKVAPGVYLASASELADDGAAKSGRDPAEDERWSRIVGGSATTIEEWPWQAGITANPALYAGNAFERRFCGGSLVAPTIVITAAHCTFEVFGSSGFDDPANFATVTGRTMLTTSQGQETGWSDYYVFVDSAGNPLHNPETSEWDVVFAKLASPSPSPTIAIAGASEAAFWAPANENAWATGWGSTMSGGAQQNTLREVNLDILADSVCGAPTSYGSGYIPETMLCAGEAAGGQDTCQGDSGGPLVVPIGPGGTGPFRLVGDTSFGLGCALPNFPGVYGRVAQHPVCTALQKGIQDVAAADVVGPGGCLNAGDPECAVPVGSVGTPCPTGGVPDTAITKGPKNKTKKKKATFEFVSSIPGSSFTCTLDGKARKAPCTSPFMVKVKKGRHTFQVAATDPGGNTYPTPASDSWKRKRKKKKR
jgi:Trypsin